MFCVVGNKNEPNHVQQDPMHGTIEDVRLTAKWGRDPDSQYDRKTNQSNGYLRTAQLQRLCRELRMQRDYRTKMNHLRCHKCLDQVCGVGIPREPFAKSRTGEARQKEADREPSGTTGGYTSTFGVHAVNRKTNPDNEDIAERGRKK
jgi:hypothetical protein